MNARALLLVLLAGAGCGSKVRSEALALFQVSAGDLPEFDRYTFSVVDHPEVAPQSLGRQQVGNPFSFGYYLSGLSGRVLVKGQAVTLHGCVVGEGTGSTEVTAGKTSAAVELTIVAIAPEGLACPGDLSGVDGGSSSDAPALSDGASSPVDVPISPQATGDARFLGAEAGMALANGAPCMQDGACLSGMCVDQVCCEARCGGQCQTCASDGKCVTVVGPPVGGRKKCDGEGVCAGSCDGMNGEVCRYSGMERVCAEASCSAGSATSRAVCDGKGHCSSPTVQSCGGLPCQGTICAGGCSAQLPCPSDSYCSGGRCMPRQAVGASCTDNAMCASGACTDGVCCEGSCTDACQSCAIPGSLGRCLAVKSADDDRCNGLNTCDPQGACKRRSGGECSAAAECATAACVDGRCCSTSACGSCQGCTGGGGSCVAVTNKEDPDSCSGTQTCDASGACKKKLAQGCFNSSECALGHCADGKCCDVACSGPCQSCVSGSCGPVVNGDDDTCTGTQSCNAAAVCKKKAGQACGADGDCLLANCVDGKCCDQACRGTCQTCASGSCSAVGAGIEDLDPPGSCSGTRACDGTFGPTACKKKNGQGCSAGGECVTGNCVGNICCDTPCNGDACHSCSLPGKVGTCSLSVDLQNDVNNCGRCGTVCPARNHANPKCSMGTCGITCVGLWGDCNKVLSDGCEQSLDQDSLNCGTCGAPCQSDATYCFSCSGGICYQCW